jgi:TolB protein
MPYFVWLKDLAQDIVFRRKMVDCYHAPMRALALFLLALLAPAAKDSGHISNIRQLTFGGSNAEAYWSPDGKRLVFQSTRDGRECDQIYIMNADGSGVHMVSTGKGRTTCGYFLPDNKTFVYASTHLGGAGCPPPPDRSKGYVWPVYPTYDLFVATDRGQILRQLTKEPGYDAEVTVNWKDRKLVYTSMASGDLDLWSMNLDGSNKKQLTHEVGYDGGGVFSRDGKKLVWRGNHPKTPEALDAYKKLLADNLTTPMKMELYLADADGKNVQQLTNYGCASFAPTFSPDGRKILFSSNKNHCDSRQFELFLMDTDGNNVEQVTSFGGFTAFPEFSPDGKQIVFISDRNAKQRYEFNVFVADWRW